MTLLHVSYRLYNHIQQPSKLGFGCDYCLFKVRLFKQFESKASNFSGKALRCLQPVILNFHENIRLCHSMS